MIDYVLVDTYNNYDILRESKVEEEKEEEFLAFNGCGGLYKMRKDEYEKCVLSNIERKEKELEALKENLRKFK